MILLVMFAPPLITEAAKLAPGILGKLKLGLDPEELGTEDATLPVPAVSEAELLINGR